jgi:hypothetical protein
MGRALYSGDSLINQLFVVARLRLSRGCNAGATGETDMSGLLARCEHIEATASMRQTPIVATPSGQLRGGSRAAPRAPGDVRKRLAQATHTEVSAADRERSERAQEAADVLAAELRTATSAASGTVQAAALRKIPRPSAGC